MKMERLLSAIALLIGSCVALALPCVSFYVGYGSHENILATEAEINARLVTRLINENPELWRVVVPRLEELLGKRPGDKTPENRLLFDAAGELVAQSRDRLDPPFVARDATLYDAGRAVGRLRIERSLRPLLAQTAWLCALGLLLGGGVFVALKVLPLHALRRSHERLQREATHDALTGLPNRLLFLDRLEQAMLRAQRGGRPLALMFIDLDHFKTINDGYGHHVGDQALQHVARELAACLDDKPGPARRANDAAITLARLGGDEFTVLVENAGTVVSASQLAERLLEALGRPFTLGGRTHSLQGSVGIAMYPQDDVNLDQLLRHADMAMYRAKELGRNRYHFFNHELNENIQRRIELDNALLGALERREFVLHYQPLADLQQGTICGVEALLRWHRPGVGLVQPEEFIGALEDTRLIVPVGAWVIETACAQLVAWDRAGLPPFSMAINLSAWQFRDPELPARIEHVLHSTGLAPQRLELELTESLLMDDNAASRVVLERLDALGVAVAIDDFGTGYSSLAYLKRFKVDTLKLDRSFVRDLPHDAENGAIAAAVVALAHTLGLKVVCEGVETETQRDFLRCLGADVYQGFLLSKPLGAHALGEWLRRRDDGAPLGHAQPVPSSGLRDAVAQDFALPLAG